ncbi:MAG TPA: hypothetical protein P5346_00005 [Spirochaetota bacterium]|nr:hypothetical protein [Spirochaetota bacterium]HSA13096.1 hypothetical protein [Spirochaetota bacterium]
MNKIQVIGISVIACLILLISAGPNRSYCKTRVTVSGPFTDIGISQIGKQFDDIIQKNGVPIANAFAMTNISGYPIGEATLGVFPAFFVGVAAGAGLSNLDYFDSEKTVSRGVVPVGGINPVLYFGLGLSKDFDFIGKVFVYSDDFYLPEFKYESARLSALSFYSFGARARYCFLKEKKIIPGLLKFGGMNVSLGVDFLYGIIGFEGRQSYPLESVEVDTGTGPMVVDLDFEPDYTANLEWYIISLTPQIAAYVNILWVFNVYLGFAFPINFGSFNVNIDGKGEVTTDTAGYTGPDPVGSVSIKTSNEYAPMVVIPALVIGLELAIWKIYLSFETNVNLINREDINMQLAFRIQI